MQSDVLSPEERKGHVTVDIAAILKNGHVLSLARSATVIARNSGK
jgi:hypothetical protein